MDPRENPTLKLYRLHYPQTNTLQDINRLRRQLSPDVVDLNAQDLYDIVRDEFVRLLVISHNSDPQAPNSLVAMLTLTFYRTLGGWVGRIEDVVVDRSWQGHGLGRWLIQAAKTEALAMRRTNKPPGLSTLRKLWLSSRPERVAANRLYQSEGFQPHRTNVSFWTLPQKDR